MNLAKNYLKTISKNKVKHPEAIVANCKLKKWERNDEAPRIVCIDNSAIQGIQVDNRI
jgi:hypothetical protein